MSSKSPVHYSNSYSLPLCPTPRPCHFSYAALSILGEWKRSGSLWQHLAYLRKLSACSHTLTFSHGRNHKLSRSLWAVSCAALGCVCVCNTSKVKLFSLTLFNVSKITFFSPILCWDFSIGLMDFHGGIFVLGWLSELVSFGGKAVKKFSFCHFGEVTLCVVVRNILKALFNLYRCLTHQRNKEQTLELNSHRLWKFRLLFPVVFHILIGPMGLIVILEKS